MGAGAPTYQVRNNRLEAIYVLQTVSIQHPRGPQYERPKASCFCVVVNYIYHEPHHIPFPFHPGPSYSKPDRISTL